MKHLTKKWMSIFLALGLAASITLVAPVTLAVDHTGVMELIASERENNGRQLLLTLGMKNLRFNAGQVVLEYDPACLEPSDIDTNEEPENPYRFIQFSDDLFNNNGDNPEGWLEEASTRWNGETPVEEKDIPYSVELVFTVVRESENDIVEKDAAVLDSEGTILYTLSFRVKDDATLTDDCIRLGSKENVPNGVAIYAYSDELDEEGNYIPSPIDAASAVRIDLSAVVSGETEPGTGDDNTGDDNTGDDNTGDDNTGDDNTGDDSTGGGSTGGGSTGGGSIGGDSTGGGSVGGGSIGGGIGGGDIGGGSIGGGDIGGDETTTPDTNIENNGSDAEKPANPVALTDISGHWAKDYIEKLVAKEIVTGYVDGTFRPGSTLTRGECAIFIARAFDLPGGTETTSEFTDCSGWIAPYVNALKKAGLTSGTGDGKYSPGGQATRQEIVVMLAKAKGLTGGGELTFTDSDAIASWAKDYVSAAVSAGLVNGLPDGSFAPSRVITRGEMAKLIAEVMN